MEIQVITDIHLELYKTYIKIKPLCKYLCLAGDIGNISNDNNKNKFISFLNYYNKNWIKILYIFSNNDTLSYTEIEKEITNIINQYENIYLLNNSYIELENINIYGTTLWTYCQNQNIYIIYQLK